MKKYFIYQNDQQEGPLSLEELKRRNIGRETLVWYDGLADWKRAEELDELNELLAGSIPPPVSAPLEMPPAPRFGEGGPTLDAPGIKPKNWLVESILVTLLCCLPFGIVGIVNAAKVDSLFAAGDYAGARKASEEAGRWTKIGFYVGIGVIILYIIYMVTVMGTVLSSGGF